jgi:hypothetical protein
LAEAIRHPVRRIVVTVQVGTDRMAPTDDPVFLGLRGPTGREFRLHPAHGRGWRRASKEIFVLGGSDDPETNVARPELNDPAHPSIDASRLTGVYLRKGMEPIPNVRGHGEMDDRIQVEWIEVEIHSEGLSVPMRYARREAAWLGLVCGLFIELAPVDAA